MQHKLDWWRYRQLRSSIYEKETQQYGCGNMCYPNTHKMTDHDRPQQNKNTEDNNPSKEHTREGSCRSQQPTTAESSKEQSWPTIRTFAKSAVLLQKTKRPHKAPLTAVGLRHGQTACSFIARKERNAITLCTYSRKRRDLSRNGDLGSLWGTSTASVVWKNLHNMPMLKLVNAFTPLCLYLYRSFRNSYNARPHLVTDCHW